MMAKITKGSSFGGCVRYVMTKKDAKLIAANGVLHANHRTVAESFEAQAQLNPRLGRKVGHISLNFPAQDRDKIDNAFILGVAREYMHKMGIADTQFIIVRHNDREHPHCHIVFNRVSNSGKTISDQNDRLRSVKACRALTEKHELYLKETDTKQDVKRERLMGTDKVKYDIYDAIKDALPHCTDWGELRTRLEKEGISLTYKFKGSTNQKEGVIFTKDGQSFNGSKVDRQFSYSKLDAAMNKNARRQREPVSQTRSVGDRQSVQAERQTPTFPPRQSHSTSAYSDSGGIFLGGLFDIKPGTAHEEEAPFRRPKRKKKKGQGRSMG